MEDYASDSERKAYNKGIIARINGHSENDNPYRITRGTTKSILEGLTLYNAWSVGYNEKGSIAEKPNRKQRW